MKNNMAMRRARGLLSYSKNMANFEAFHCSAALEHFIKHKHIFSEEWTRELTTDSFLIQYIVQYINITTP